MFLAFKISVKILFTFFLLAVLSYPFLTHALSENEITLGPISYSSSYTFPDTEPDITDYIPDFVDVPEGGIAWDVFAETKSEEYKKSDDNGIEFIGVKPVFSDDLKKLDGQTILIQGYMFPLDDSDEQSLFLFGPFPVSCPYHYHAGPNLIIEAHSKDKISFEWDAVNIEGRLELVAQDDEFNVFYRLHEAKQVK